MYGFNKRQIDLLIKKTYKPEQAENYALTIGDRGLPDLSTLPPAKRQENLYDVLNPGANYLGLFSKKLEFSIADNVRE